ncbi:MAG TPA: ATP-binding cassette domain-containing protein [Rhodospirillales bacterium]|nr:ATP-binding cassette domain-containing protein [Rhodospirillales bacterium]
MTPPPILALEGVQYAYRGDVPALRGLDLEVPAGCRVAVLGANGAGKTTALLHLNGSLRPKAGAVYRDGRPARYDRASLRAWRAEVSLVLQDPDDQLFAGTVYEDVSFGPMNLGLEEGEVRRRVDEALAGMDIVAHAARPIHMLSYGQRRRAALAGALAMRPRVLVLDEPTAGLDAQGAAGLLRSLDRLVTARRSVIYSTHDGDLAYAWSDWVVVLEDGMAVANGVPEEVLADAAALGRAGLRVPVALAIGLHARALGLIAPAAPLPRSADEVDALLLRITRAAASEAEGRPPVSPAAVC